MKNVVLHNVIDTRTGQFHSIAIVKQRNAKWFVYADEWQAYVSPFGG